MQLSSSDGVEAAAEFLERRRACLQRYMQRTAALPHLRADPDFREFIELGNYTVVIGHHLPQHLIFL